MITARHRVPGLELTDHRFELPLDYSDPNGRKTEVFAREAVDVTKTDADLPWLIFLQGGPGGLSPRPEGKLLLDQRGVGLSSPISFHSLAGMSPEDQAEHLCHFRSDNIVRDCEAIRQELAGGRRWTTLGQSYGGFCTLRYLSESPDGLEASLITGGVPSIDRHIDDVYRATFKTLVKKNQQFYERYPGDRDLAKRIADHLAANDVRLPDGDRFTVNRFRQLGMGFGMKNGWDKLHYLMEKAFVGGKISHAFLTEAHAMFNFDGGPIFAILHEAIYCQGHASNWSADRVREEFAEFSDDADEFNFMGEMIGRWMFDEFSTLKPLKASADILASKSDWPELYSREGLKKNKVKTACAVYTNDMYVPRDWSMETVEAVPHMLAWETSEYEHCGLRTGSDHVFGRLLDMVDGTV
jgi:pimeloyl-ACP methyl ester carboxylesterase